MLLKESSRKQVDTARGGGDNHLGICSGAATRASELCALPIRTGSGERTVETRPLLLTKVGQMVPPRSRSRSEPLEEVDRGAEPQPEVAQRREVLRREEHLSPARRTRGRILSEYQETEVRERLVRTEY